MEEKEQGLESSEKAAPGASWEPEEEPSSLSFSQWASQEHVRMVFVKLALPVHHALTKSEEKASDESAKLKVDIQYIEPIEPNVEARIRAIKPPRGRVIREGDYPPMQAVKREDGTWVLVKREKPTTLWGRVKALLF